MAHTGSLRAIVLGMNDGHLSTWGLVVGGMDGGARWRPLIWNDTSRVAFCAYGA
jgi:hypothetical protein